MLSIWATLNLRRIFLLDKLPWDLAEWCVFHLILYALLCHQHRQPSVSHLLHRRARAKRNAKEPAADGEAKRGRPRGSQNAADADNLPGTSQPSQPSKKGKGKGRRKQKEPKEQEETKEPEERKEPITKEPKEPKQPKQPKERKQPKEPKVPKEPKKPKGKAAPKKCPTPKTAAKSAAKSAAKKTDNSNQVVGA